MHTRFVSNHRANALAKLISTPLPKDAKVLDIGCGDGLVDQEIINLRPDVKIIGLEVAMKVHHKTQMLFYDGNVIPFPDNTFDVTLLIDVTHHCANPEGLIKEATRTSKNTVIIKDHLCENYFDRLTLKFMDWVGNRPYGVPVTYRYWGHAKWNGVWKNFKLKTESITTKLCLRPILNSLIDRRLNFLAVLVKAK